MIIKDHYGSKYGFEVRGPLNVAQLEKEFGKSHEETAAMNRLKNPYREGDEVYFFTSDVQSWSDRAGVEGYVLIRKDRIVDGIVTGMN